MKHLPRLFDVMLVTLILFGAVYWLAPQQLGIVVYKTLLVTLAAVIAYWIDRAFYKLLSERLDASMSPHSQVSAARIVARALIFIGAVLAMAFGL